MSLTPRQEKVKELLARLSDAVVAEMCLQALKNWRARNPGQRSFQMHGGLGLELVPILGAAKGHTRLDTQQLKEPFLDSQDEDWMRPVTEFILWMTHAGLVYVSSRLPTYSPCNLTLTRRGELLLDLPAQDHPLLPGFVARVQARCTGMPPGVVSLFNDAATCLGHCLLRPAVVMLGVAYEVTTEAVVGALVTKGTISPSANATEWRAAKRIAEIKALIPTTLAPSSSPADKEKRSALTAAYDFADALRGRRNDAAHTSPTYDFDHWEEIEELLFSAGRHLPALWMPAI